MMTPTPLPPPHPTQMLAWWQRVAAAALGLSEPRLLADVAAQPESMLRRLAPLGLAAWPHAYAHELQLDAATTAVWQRAAATEASAGARRQEVVTALTQALARACGWALPLKGAVTASVLYPRPELRPSYDIDLWIPAAGAAAAVAVLARLGYAPTTPAPPRFNFEWQFTADDDRPPLDLHFELTATWRTGWQPVPPTTHSEALELHAAHALAHFAQHKGAVKPVQELDLLLWAHHHLPRTLPVNLRPAAALWRLRYAVFWAGEYHHAVKDRRGALRWLYRAHAWPAATQHAHVRRLLLGLALANSPSGWMRQLLGRGGRPNNW